MEDKISGRGQGTERPGCWKNHPGNDQESVDPGSVTLGQEGK